MQNHRDPEGSAPRRRFAHCTLAFTLAALLALASCGGGDAPRKVARSPCSRAIAAAVGPQAKAALDERAPDVLTCTYRSGDRIVRVTRDTAPQAAWRFSRTVVEQGQAHLGEDRRELPQQVDGIGEGAAWTPAPRELLATDGRTLVTVTVVAPGSGGARAARAAAVSVARAALAAG